MSSNQDEYSDASYASADLDRGAPQQQQQQQLSSPLAAGSLVQLIAPVKLRPFKSAYHVQESNELRIICQAQRGFPAAHISWYIGNRLVDAEFMRSNEDQIRVLHLQDPSNDSTRSMSPTMTSANWPYSSPPSTSAGELANSGAQHERRIVEINPVPLSKQQMQLTKNGQWIEYHNFSEERYNIGSKEQQISYLKAKLSQLTGSLGRSNVPDAPTPLAAHSRQAQASGDPNLALQYQTAISVLVIRSLNITRHSSRYACRATTRANTDEVTTVIRVSGEYTHAVRLLSLASTN